MLMSHYAQRYLSNDILEHDQTMQILLESRQSVLSK